MRFLTDQDVYHSTIVLLRETGHDVVTARDLELHRAEDEQILHEAKTRGRVLLTRDKGFGALTFLKGMDAPGVILLRMQPSTVEAVHEQLKHLLETTTPVILQQTFHVIEPSRYRRRRLS